MRVYCHLSGNGLNCTVLTWCWHPPYPLNLTVARSCWEGRGFLLPSL